MKHGKLISGYTYFYQNNLQIFLKRKSSNLKYIIKINSCYSNFKNYFEFSNFQNEYRRNPVISLTISLCVHRRDNLAYYSLKAQNIEATNIIALLVKNVKDIASQPVTDKFVNLCLLVHLQWLRTICLFTTDSTDREGHLIRRRSCRFRVLDDASRM